MYPYLKIFRRCFNNHQPFFPYTILLMMFQNYWPINVINQKIKTLNILWRFHQNMSTIGIFSFKVRDILAIDITYPSPSFKIKHSDMPFPIKKPIELFNLNIFSKSNISKNLMIYGIDHIWQVTKWNTPYIIWTRLVYPLRVWWYSNFKKCYKAHFILLPAISDHGIWGCKVGIKCIFSLFFIHKSIIKPP